MNSVRKTIFYLLVLIMPLSAWVSIGVPCTQISIADLSVEPGTLDTHAHHNAAQSDDEGSNDASAGHPAHHASGNADANEAKCPCCDGCASARSGTDKHLLGAIGFAYSGLYDIGASSPHSGPVN